MPQPCCIIIMMAKGAAKAQIDLNEQFRHALNIMEHTDRNIFITGRAGTGKSTLLDYFRNTTKKKVAVGLLPHVQAMLLARFLRGDLDGYPPFIFR